MDLVLLEITLDNNFDDNKACKLETSEDVVVMPIDDGTLANRFTYHNEHRLCLGMNLPCRWILLFRPRQSLRLLKKILCFTRKS